MTRMGRAQRLGSARTAAASARSVSTRCASVARAPGATSMRAHVLDSSVIVLRAAPPEYRPSRSANAA